METCRNVKNEVIQVPLSTFFKTWNLQFPRHDLVPVFEGTDWESLKNFLKTKNKCAQAVKNVKWVVSNNRKAAKGGLATNGENLKHITKGFVD